MQIYHEDFWKQIQVEQTNVHWRCTMHFAKSSCFDAPEENTGGAQQQLGVLDQQLRKLLANPGLPAISPITLPLPAVPGEGQAHATVGQ